MTKISMKSRQEIIMKHSAGYKKSSKKEKGQILDIVCPAICTTKPGTLLKKDIPIRFGTEWEDAVPGYVEIDLVAHCGGSTRTTGASS